jgi:hypothetical protein
LADAASLFALPVPFPVVRTLGSTGSIEGSLLGARNLGFGLKLIVGGMQDNKK